MRLAMFEFDGYKFSSLQDCSGPYIFTSEGRDRDHVFREYWCSYEDFQYLFLSLELFLSTPEEDSERCIWRIREYARHLKGRVSRKLGSLMF